MGIIFRNFLNNLEDWGVTFQVHFNLATLLNNQLCQDSSVSLFGKGELGTIKDSKCPLLKMARTRYIDILIKSQKSLELAFSLLYWNKNMLKMFIIQHTSIWLNFILMTHRIQKK